MPIDTDSDAWRNAEELDRIEKEAVDFLKQHPNEAFRLRELADAVVGTRWGQVEEFNRQRDQMSDDEYQEELANRDDDRPSSLSEFRPTLLLQIVLRDLDAAGLVEVRRTPADAFKDAYQPDVDEVIAYAYAESDSASASGE